MDISRFLAYCLMMICDSRLTLCSYTCTADTCTTDTYATNSFNVVQRSVVQMPRYILTFVQRNSCTMDSCRRDICKPGKLFNRAWKTDIFPVIQLSICLLSFLSNVRRTSANCSDALYNCPLYKWPLYILHTTLRHTAHKWNLCILHYEILMNSTKHHKITAVPDAEYVCLHHFNGIFQTEKFPWHNIAMTSGYFFIQY